jgi:RNA polymerase sigma-70 factor, ECF subfamily
MDFAAAVEPHRPELRRHCYRLVGSYDEAEDLVQETFLKAWRRWDDFAGRSSVRTWLFRIATNTCLDHLDGRPRRGLPDDPGTVEWLQPYPDEPGDSAVARETIELAFLAAIQHLPPRSRAVLILRDVLGWPAADTAEALELTVAAANSALQRGRVTLRERLPPRRADWTATPATADERAVLRRYMNAVERADLRAVAELLAADVRATMPPYAQWFAGRDATVAALARSWDPDAAEFVGRFAAVEVRVNGGPGAATWTTLDGRTYSAFAISVIRVEGDRIAEMIAFHDPRLFEIFRLPMTFPAGDRLPR